jgi:hypothetical protein
MFINLQNQATPNWSANRNEQYIVAKLVQQRESNDLSVAPKVISINKARDCTERGPRVLKFYIEIIARPLAAGTPRPRLNLSRSPSASPRFCMRFKAKPTNTIPITALPVSRNISAPVLDFPLQRLPPDACATNPVRRCQPPRTHRIFLLFTQTGASRAYSGRL